MAKERGFWTDERILRVASLAANGLYGSDIAADIGCSLHSVLTICGRNAINVNRYNPEQQAYFEQKSKEREARKNAKRRKGPARSARSEFIFRPGTSKTSPIYRNQFEKLPADTSKAQLRAMIAEAFRNTAEARA